METIMRMHLSKKFALSLLSTSLMLTGCGGGSDETNTPPEQTPPPVTPTPSEPENKAPSVSIAEASDLKEQVEFTLSANASDEDGEIKTYAWQHNSDVAISAKDTNTASPRFTVGDIKEDVDITFTVSVTDDDGATATSSKQVTVKRKVSSVTITGIVTDEPIPNADVYISVGDLDQQTKANEQGEYSSLLSVDDSEKSRLVKIRAVGPSGTKDENVEFVSQLNSVEALVEQAGDDGELTKEDNFAVNVTNVSTAEYVLIQKSETPIETDAQLQSALTGVDAEEKLELASLIKIAVDKDVDLPEGVESTLELISNEQTAEEFKKTALEKDANIIEDTKEEIKDDKDLVNGLTGELVGNYIINSPVDYSNGAYLLELKADGKAVIVAKNIIEATWQHDESGTVVLAISEDNPLIISSETHLDPETGVATELKEAVFDISFTIVAQNSIFKTIELTQTLTQQSVNQSTTTVAKFVTNLFDKQQTILIEPADVIGQWSLQTFSKQQAKANINQLKFNDDNSVTSSEFKNATWQLLGNTLQINYETSNGTADSLQLWLTKQYSDAYQFIALTGNAESSEFVEQGLFIKHDDTELTDALIKGKWSGYVGLNRPSHTINIFDDLSAGFGLNKGGWQTSLTGNTIMLSRYKLNGEVVSQCDEALNECLKEHKQLEVLASSDKRYFLNYKGSDISTTLSDTGALTIFNYEKLILDQPSEDEGFTYAMFEEPSSLYFDNASGTTEYFNIVVEEVNGIKQGNLVISGQSYSFNIAGGKISYTQDGKTYFIELLSQSEKGLEICWFQQGATCTDAQKGQLLFSVDDVTGYFVPQITFSPAPSEGYKEQVENQIKANVVSFDDEVIYSWQVPTGLDVVFSGLETDTLSFSTSDITSDLDFDVQLTITDRLGQSTSQTQSIKVLRNTSKVTLSGIVTDSPIANAQVTAQAGQTSVQVQAGNDGTYLIELEVDETETEQLVMLSARGSEANNQTHIEFKSLLPSTTSLKHLAGEDGILNKEESFAVNVTNVSTAEFALLNQLGLPNNEADLSSRLLGVDAEQKLALATLIKAIVDHGIELPPGVDSTLELINNTQASVQLTESIEQNNPGLLDSILEDIKADSKLLSGLRGDIVGDYFINSPNYYTNQAIHIKLEADGTAQLSASNQVTAQWRLDGSSVEIIFDEQQPFYLWHWHTEGVLYQSQLTSLNFIVLAENEHYKTIEWQWNIKRFENGTEQPQEQGDNGKSLSNLFDKQHTVALTASELLGTWSLQSYNDSDSNTAIEQLTFAEDGTIIDADGNVGMLWQLIDSKLQITYEDRGENQTIDFWFSKTWGNGAAYNFTAVDTNTEPGQTMFGLMVKHANLFVAESEIPGSWRGFIGHPQTPFDMNIDDDLNVRIGLNDNWSFGRYENGVFYRERYLLYGAFVGYCDESLDGCSINRRMTFRFLNRVGEQYYVSRTYSQMNELGEVEADKHRLFIFDKSELNFTQFTVEMLNDNSTVYIQNIDGTITSININPGEQSDSFTLVIDEQVYTANLVNGSLQYIDAEDNLHILEILSGDFNSMQVCWYQQGEICDEAATLFYDLPSFTVSSSTDGNGIVSPEQIELAYNAQTSFTITPNSGYRIEEVLGCNGELARNIYTVSNLTQDCQVEVSFVVLQGSDVVSDLVFYDSNYFNGDTFHITQMQDGTALITGASYSGFAQWYREGSITYVTPLNELVIEEDNYLGDGDGTKTTLVRFTYEQIEENSDVYQLTIDQEDYYSTDGVETSREQITDNETLPARHLDEHSQAIEADFTGEWALNLSNIPWILQLEINGQGFYREAAAEQWLPLQWSLSDGALELNLESERTWKVYKTVALEVGQQVIVTEHDDNDNRLAIGSGLLVQRGDIAIDADNFSGRFAYVYGWQSELYKGEEIIYENGAIGTLLSSFLSQGEFSADTYVRRSYWDSAEGAFGCEPDSSSTCELHREIGYRLIATQGNLYFIERYWQDFDIEGINVADYRVDFLVHSYNSSVKVPEFEYKHLTGRSLYDLSQVSTVAWRFRNNSIRLNGLEEFAITLEAGKLHYYDHLQDKTFIVELLDNTFEGITICSYQEGDTCQEQDHVQLVKEVPVHIVTTETDGNGEVGTVGAAEYLHGSKVWLPINPNQGYELESISGCNGYIEGEEYRIDYVKNSCTVVATFKEIVPLSEQAGITDEGLAQCVDNSGYQDVEQVTELFCNQEGLAINDITGLDAFVNLTALSLSNVTMAEFDFSALVYLDELHLDNGQLTNVVVSNPALIKALTITNSGLTDDALQNVQLNQYVNLERLNLHGNLLTQLDISALSGLKELRVGENTLNSLDIRGNTLLDYLEASGNQLEQLDVSNNQKLRLVFVQHNALNALSFTAHNELIELHAWSNQLELTDVSGAPKLVHLDVEINKLTELNVSNNPELKLLWLDENPISTLDLSQNSLLETLYLDSMPLLKGFDTSNLVNLKYLDISQMPYDSIEFSNLVSLEDFTYRNAGLVEFNINVPDGLKYLNLSGNNLAALDISRFVNLERLLINFNPITELDLSGSQNLKELSIESTNISNLDISNNNLLENVYAQSAQIETVSGLHLIDNRSAWLDFQNNPLSDDTVAEFERLIQDEGFTNLNYSIVYNIVINTVGEGTVSQTNFTLSDGQNMYVNLWPNEGYEVGTISGCDNNFEFVDANTLLVGSVTQSCEIQIEFVTATPLSEKAKIADPVLASCVDQSGQRYIQFANSVSCWDEGVQSLSGLENLTHLSSVSLGRLDIGEQIDLSHIANLKEVSIDLSTFSSIKVADPTQIEGLSLTYSNLQSYDLSAFTGLVRLNLSGNDGMVFDLSQVPNIQSLNLNDMSLSSLDLSAVDQLVSLSAFNNLLTNVDISHLNQLTYLDLGGNNLTALSFSIGQPINQLMVWGNQFEQLDVTKLEQLEFLYAGGMATLNSLVTHGATSLPLRTVDISGSSIVQPDFTHLNSLYRVDLSDISHENVDFAKLGNINDLVMQRSGLTTFDTVWVPSVERLSLGGNQLTQIHIANPEKLIYLELGNNALTQIDTTGLVNLDTLWIPNNPIGALDLTGLEKLLQLDLSETDVAEIDVMHTPDLSYIHAVNSGIQQILNLNSLQHQLDWLWLDRTPLTTEMLTLLADLSNQEGYGNISYSFAHSVVLKTNEFGSVYARRANIEDGVKRSIYFIPNEGYKLGTYSGCENIEYNEENDWLDIGPITQSCELILEFVPIN